VVIQFTNLLQEEHPGYEDHRSPAELISLINPILRRHEPAAVERVYQALIRHGRVTPQLLSSAAIGRLARAGVLVNSTRSAHVIAPRYRLALRALHAVDGRWQGQ
jgi:hypothetical protein